MYADIHARIEKIRGQIESVSYRMIEAEGEDYDKLSDKLERLEDKLERYTVMANDLEDMRRLNE